MKNIWKWILGIILVLVVVAGLVGVAFVFHNRLNANFAYRTMPNTQGTPGAPAGAPTPQAPGPGYRNWRGPMMGGGGFRGGPGPMMGGRGGRGFGYGPFHGGMAFGPGMMIVGGLMRLVPLALLVVLLVIAYRLGKRDHAGVSAPAATAVPAPAPTPTHACPKCGNDVQDGWNHCPNCGEKQ